MSIHSCLEHPAGDCLSTVAQNTLWGDCLSTVAWNTLRGDCLFTVTRNTLRGDCLFTVTKNTLWGDCLSTVAQNTLWGDCLFTVTRNRGQPHPRQPGQSTPHWQLDQRKFTRSVLEAGSPGSRACRAAPQGSKGRSGTLSTSAVGVCPGLRHPPHPWHVEASPQPLPSPFHGVRAPWCVSVSTFPPFINNNRTGIGPSQ